MINKKQMIANNHKNGKYFIIYGHQITPFLVSFTGSADELKKHLIQTHNYQFSKKILTIKKVVMHRTNLSMSMLASFWRGHVDNFACFAFQNNETVFTKGRTLHRDRVWCSWCSALKFSSVGHGLFLLHRSNKQWIGKSNIIIHRTDK